MRIKNDQLKELLQEFRRIIPRAEFSRQSRSFIVAHRPNKQAQTVQPHITPITWSEYLRMGSLHIIRIGSFVTVTTVIILISFYATRELSPLLLPGLNTQRITAEAQMLNSVMNIELNNLGYFNISSQESTHVLEQFSQKQLHHLNDTIIKSEATELNQAASSSIPDPSTDLNLFIQELSK